MPGLGTVSGVLIDNEGEAEWGLRAGVLTLL